MARKKGGEITLLEMKADALELLSDGIELSDEVTAAFEATSDETDSDVALVFYAYDGEEMTRLTPKEALSLHNWLLTNAQSVWALAQESKA